VSAATATAPVAFDDRHTHTTLWHVIRSEWTKFWSVRSTVWTLLILIVATIGISVLASWGTTQGLSKMDAHDRATLDVVNLSVAGIGLGQLALVVLGALLITTEYSTGGVKATFTAVPQRLKVLTAKGIILAVVSLIVGLITSFVAFYAAMPFWNHYHLGETLNDPGVLRAVIGAGLYLFASAMFGFALGTIIRHTAGAITAGVALLLVVAPLLNLLPGTWGHDIFKFFTSNAGGQIVTTVQDPKLLTPWSGYITMTVWWIVPLLVGAYLLKRRDA
jgi:ABC-type transport system involved in multi-copper enzyme maturation permease subunit